MLRFLRLVQLSLKQDQRRLLQALTNPLLSEHIWGDEANRRLTFTDDGLAAIAATNTLRDILLRNSRNLGDRFVGMTRRDWERS